MRYPYFKLVLRTKKGKVVQTYVTQVKERIMSILTGKKKIRSTKNEVKGHIYDISIYYAKGFWNKGVYDDLEDAKYAYSCFTSKWELEDYARTV